MKPPTHTNFLFFVVSTIILLAIKLCKSLESKGERSLYDILECNKDCSLSELKKNYRKLALELHPDKIPPSLSEEEKERLKNEFLDVQDAYDT